MKLIPCMLLMAVLAWPAGDPAGFHAWSAAELKAFSQSLGPKVTPDQPATQQVLAFGNYSMMMSMRKADGQSELHETQADIFVVETGQATLVYGGEMVGGKTTAPHEIRGTGIKGGMERKLGPGDIVMIPAKLPHQLKLAKGAEFLYAVVKVTQ